MFISFTSHAIHNKWYMLMTVKANTVNASVYYTTQMEKAHHNFIMFSNMGMLFDTCYIQTK